MSRDDTFIFIDTCSLLDSCWDCRGHGVGLRVTYSPNKEHTFWDVVLPSLALIGEIVVTARNYEELLRLMSVSDDGRPMLAERCTYVLKRLRPLIDGKSVLIVGDPNDPFADAILLSAALKFRTQKNLLFITQDQALASDLESISTFDSIRPRGYEMKVRRLSASGDIEAWRFMEGKKGAKALRASAQQTPTPNVSASTSKEWWL